MASSGRRTCRHHCFDRSYRGHNSSRRDPDLHHCRHRPRRLPAHSQGPRVRTLPSHPRKCRQLVAQKIDSAQAWSAYPVVGRALEVDRDRRHCRSRTTRVHRKSSRESRMFPVAKAQIRHRVPLPTSHRSRDWNDQRGPRARCSSAASRTNGSQKSRQRPSMLSWAILLTYENGAGAAYCSIIGRFASQSHCSCAGLKRLYADGPRHLRAEIETVAWLNLNRGVADDERNRPSREHRSPATRESSVPARR